LSELDDCYQLFAGIEVERFEVLFDLGNWPQPYLTFRPSAEAWCAVEVLDHIVKSESGMLKRVCEGLQQPHPLINEDRSRVASLERALRSDRKFPVPSGARSTYPNSQARFSEVIERWEEARIELRHVLNTVSSKNIHCGVFQHPFVGWMTFSDVLRNFSAHLYHHRLQLARIWVSASA
jgi:DinB superfamily